MGTYKNITFDVVPATKSGLIWLKDMNTFINNWTMFKSSIDQNSRLVVELDISNQEPEEAKGMVSELHENLQALIGLGLFDIAQID